MRDKMWSIIDSFKPTKPVFKIVKVYGESLNLKAIEERVQVPTTNDPIEAMLCLNIQEHFTGEKYVIDRDATFKFTVESLIRKVKAFYENHCGLEKPRRSHVYKWLSRGGHNIEAENGFLLLYPYLCSLCDPADDISAVTNKEAAANCIRILELMRQRHEK